jgi:cation transport regulator ChaC
VKSHQLATVDLRPGEAGIFGYGSLLSRASLERTLGREYTPALQTASLRGWRRTWDVRQPNRAFYAETDAGHFYPENILYLNVTAHPGSVLNGVIIVVMLEELLALDQREWMYDRLAVTKDFQDARINDGDVFLYVAKPEFVIRNVRSPRTAAVRATYLAIVEAGLAELGVAFRADYERSTDPVPGHLVIDDFLDPGQSNAPAKPTAPSTR